MGQCAGVLVIRAWCESDHEGPFRARVLAVGTSLDEVELVAVTSSSSEVLEVVRDWLSRSAPSH
jgi:hypothetical protein